MSRMEKFKKILEENIKNYKNILELLKYISKQIKFRKIDGKIKTEKNLNLDEKFELQPNKKNNKL